MHAIHGQKFSDTWRVISEPANRTSCCRSGPTLTSFSRDLLLSELPLSDENFNLLKPFSDPLLLSLKKSHFVTNPNDVKYLLASGNINGRVRINVTRNGFKSLWPLRQQQNCIKSILVFPDCAKKLQYKQQSCVFQIPMADSLLYYFVLFPNQTLQSIDRFQMLSISLRNF